MSQIDPTMTAGVEPTPERSAAAELGQDPTEALWGAVELATTRDCQEPRSISERSRLALDAIAEKAVLAGADLSGRAPKPINRSVASLMASCGLSRAALAIARRGAEQGWSDELFGAASEAFVAFCLDSKDELGVAAKLLSAMPAAPAWLGRALRLAAECGRADLLRLALDLGAPLDGAPGEIQPLLMAIVMGKAETAKILWAAGSRLPDPLPEGGLGAGADAFDAAVEIGDDAGPECARWLLSLPELAGLIRAKPLAARVERAARAGAVGQLKELLRAREAALGDEAGSERLPDHVAAELMEKACDRGDLELLRMALSLASGPDVRLDSELGETPLMIAIERQEPDCVEELLARGADPKALDHVGDSVEERLSCVSHYPGLERIESAMRAALEAREIAGTARVAPVHGATTPRL